MPPQSLLSKIIERHRDSVLGPSPLDDVVHVLHPGSAAAAMVMTRIIEPLAFSGYVGVGVIPGPEHRAQCLIPHVPQGCVIALKTAHWVYCGGDSPDVIDVISRSHRRLPRKPYRFNCKESAISPEDCVMVRDLVVTSVERTGRDIAVFYPDEAPQLLTGLVLGAGLNLNAVMEVLKHTKRQKALQIVKQVQLSLESIDVENSIDSAHST